MEKKLIMCPRKTAQKSLKNQKNLKGQKNLDKRSGRKARTKGRKSRNPKKQKQRRKLKLKLKLHQEDPLDLSANEDFEGK